MGEYQRKAEAIARHMAHARREAPDGKLRSGELSGIVRDVMGEAVNCYPGEPSGDCHEKAFFISLSVKLAGSSKPHLKLNDAFGAMAKHCNGVCKIELAPPFCWPTTGTPTFTKSGAQQSRTSMAFTSRRICSMAIKLRELVFEYT